tara:strand:- start:39 stop:530 length:492 start_codon:yes stop_codon:yes gene_type:complete
MTGGVKNGSFLAIFDLVDFGFFWSPKTRKSRRDTSPELSLDASGDDLDRFCPDRLQTFREMCLETIWPKKRPKSSWTNRGKLSLELSWTFAQKLSSHERVWRRSGQILPRSSIHLAKALEKIWADRFLTTSDFTKEQENGPENRDSQKRLKVAVFRRLKKHHF